MNPIESSPRAASSVDASTVAPVVSATVSTTEARSQLSVYVNRAAYGNEAIVLSRHGQPEAVLVSMEFYQICLNLLAKAK